MSIKHFLLCLAAMSYASAGADIYKVDYKKPLKPTDEKNFTTLSKQMVDLGARGCTKDASTFEFTYNADLSETLDAFDQWVYAALFAKSKTDKIIKVDASRDGANRTTFMILIDVGLGATYSQKIEYIYDVSTREFYTYRFTCYTSPYVP